MFGIPDKYKSLSISNQILDKEELKEVFDYLASSVTTTKAHNNGDGDDDAIDSLNNKKKQTIDIPTLKLLFSSLGHGDKITKKSLRILIQRIMFRQKQQQQQQQVQEKDEKIEGETVDVKKENEQATTERNYNDDSNEDKDNGGDDDDDDEIVEVDFELCWSISQELNLHGKDNEINRLFQLFDYDNSGYITLDNLKNVKANLKESKNSRARSSSNCSTNFEEEEEEDDDDNLNWMIEAFDSDLDGKLNFQEFKSIWGR